MFIVFNVNDYIIVGEFGNGLIDDSFVVVESVRNGNGII